MTPKQKIRISKYLSFLLRHDATHIDGQGWASMDHLLASLRDRFTGVTSAVIKEIVAEDDKQRYCFSADRRRLRANQGHSVIIDLDLPKMRPPEFLFHGSAKKTLWLIRRDGLLPMSRQFLHLSQNRETAVAVGKRHGDPSVIMVRAAELYDTGQAFFLSENGVWLTSSVAVQFLMFEDCNE